MFRKGLCVPRLLCHPCILCQKWVPVLRCRNLKHRVHRRLLPGDYTEYLKVQRIHRKPHPASPKGEECLCAHERVRLWLFSQIISAKYLQTCLPSLRRGRGRLPFGLCCLWGLSYHPTTGPSGCSPPSECVFFFSTFLSPFLLSLMDLSYLSYSRRWTDCFKRAAINEPDALARKWGL